MVNKLFLRASKSVVQFCLFRSRILDATSLFAWKMTCEGSVQAAKRHIQLAGVTAMTSIFPQMNYSSAQVESLEFRYGRGEGNRDRNLLKRNVRAKNLAHSRN